MRGTLQAHTTAVKKQHILDAAARVFSEKGFHAATIKDVALAAGVAHGTVYTYFESKEALLLGLFDLMSAQTVSEPPAPLPIADTPHDLLRTTFRQPLAALTSGNAELFRIIFSEALVNRTFADRLRIQILEPMLTGSAALLTPLFADQPAPADLDLRLRALSSLILGTILQRVLHDDLLEARWDDLPDLLADVVLHGLSGRSA